MGEKDEGRERLRVSVSGGMETKDVQKEVCLSCSFSEVVPVRSDAVSVAHTGEGSRAGWD